MQKHHNTIDRMIFDLKEDIDKRKDLHDRMDNTWQTSFKGDRHSVKTASMAKVVNELENILESMEELV